MKSKTVVPEKKTGEFMKHALLMGILALLIIPQLVSGGISGTAEITGNVVQFPVARFTSSITEGTAPFSVEFTDLSTMPGVTIWSWDFGDGTTSILQNPVHTFSTAGTYVVTHTVTNIHGDSLSASGTVIVSALPPGATHAETLTTSSLAPSDTVTFESGAQTGTTLDIVVNNNIPPGTITVTSYTTSPPVAAMSTPPSSYTLLGEYISIDAPFLEGNVSQMNITMKYALPLPAGVTESNLVIKCFNRTTNEWETLTGPHGVDTTNHIVWVTSGHLSDYGIMFATPTPTVTPSAPAPAPASNNAGSLPGSSDDSYPNAPKGGQGSTGSSAISLAPGQLAPAAPSAVTPVNGIGPLTSTPLTADLAGMPDVTVSWTTEINNNPAPDARLTTVIQQNPDPSALNVFTTAFNLAGLDIGSLAYVMVVQKTGIPSTGPATVSMTVPRDWVTRNGGINVIAIARMADDGTTEVLATTFAGYDPGTGYMTFTATSQHGLSTWGLFAVKPHTASSAPASGQVAPVTAPAGATSSPAPSTAGLLIAGVAGIAAVLVITGVTLRSLIRRKSM
jgi:PKD repeat protein